MGESGRASRAKRAIAQARAAFVADFARGDAASACSLYTDDACLLAPSAELVRGRAAIERFWKAGIDSGVTAVELDVLELALGPLAAWEFGRYALHLDGGAEAAERGAYVLVHEQQGDGTWRRALEMFNPKGAER